MPEKEIEERSPEIRERIRKAIRHKNGQTERADLLILEQLEEICARLNRLEHLSFRKVVQIKH